MGVMIRENPTGEPESQLPTTASAKETEAGACRGRESEREAVFWGASRKIRPVWVSDAKRLLCASNAATTGPRPV